MKKLLQIFFFFFLFINQSKSQYSIAGVHGSIFADIIPDTLLNTTPTSSGDEHYFIDINQDGVNEIEITAHCVEHGSNYVNISSLDLFTSFTLGSIDSTYESGNNCCGCWDIRTILKRYYSGDTIKNRTYVSSGYLGYENGSPICFTMAISSQWVNIGDVFFGIKYATAMDTSYGWVKVNSAGYSNVLIEEFSLGSPLVGVHLFDINNFISVYPNPSSGLFTLFSSEKISSIEILDVLGNQVFKKQVQSQKEEINLSSHPKGIYFVKVMDEKGSFGVRKVVLQ